MLMRDQRDPQQRDWSILSWLSLRYGFVEPNPMLIRSVVPDTVQKNWVHYLGVRGVEKRQDDVKYVFDIEYFADCLQNYANASGLIWSLSDLHHENRRYLHPSQSLINVDRVRLERAGHIQNFYYISPKAIGEKYSWFMAVEEATSVVMAIRKGWGKNLETLVKWFQHFGLPFRTFKVQKVTNRPVVQFKSGIGHLKAPDRDFNLTDFAEYEDERERFFSSPRGRAVIGHGGLIRRLYQLNESEQAHRLRMVMQGPTERAAFDGDAYTMYFRLDSIIARSIDKRDYIQIDCKVTEKGIEVKQEELDEQGEVSEPTSIEPSVWCAVTVHDDALSTREKEFVMGVYDTANGYFEYIYSNFVANKFHLVPHYDKAGMLDPPRLSWFQHPSIFVANHFGSNGGIWAPNDEIGFRLRLKNIAENQETLNKNDQKKTMTSKTKAVDERYENICRIYLEDLAEYVRDQADFNHC
ncbi:hypothetical protein BDZ97DRAFT_1775688 [Flammula alnicola]|nr:hypothetical protein BDZ97DRAFT_1775688 [Flammula alnicola]